MAYDKKLYKSDVSVIDSSVIYDDTQAKLQSEINGETKQFINELTANPLVYHSLSQLNLSGTPTLAAVYNAMANGSIAIFDNSVLDQTGMTLPDGSTNPASAVTFIRISAGRGYAFGSRAYNGITMTASNVYYAAWDGTKFVGWKKIYTTDNAQIQASDVYDSNKSKTQNTINSDLQNAIDTTIKKNVQSQTISTMDNATTQLSLQNNGTSIACLRADAEGGNLRLAKSDVNFSELDTNSMNASGTGYTRLYVTDGSSSSNFKTFQFRQDGSFEDGNGINTRTLNADKMNKSGDTMTGNLTIADENSRGIYLKDLSHTVGQTISSDYYTTGLRFLDKNATMFTAVNSILHASGSVTAQLTVQEEGVSNFVRLTIDSSGNRSVSLSDAVAWRKALGIGTNGNLPIPISQGGTGATSAANALSALGAMPAAGKKISGTDTTSGASDYASAIKNIITAAAPQGWDVGVYMGAIQKTNSGTQNAWSGLYILAVITKNVNWGTQGLALVQGHIYNIWYRDAQWAATKLDS